MSLPTALALIFAGAALFAAVAWWRGWIGGSAPVQPAGGSADPAEIDPVSRSLPEALAVTDRLGLVDRANPAFSRLFGAVTEVRGSTFAGLTGHRELDLLVAETLSAGGVHSIEIDQTLDRVDGRPVSRHLVASCAPLEDGSGAVLSARDITDSVLLGQIRRDLVANVSHEIKTPLTAIRGFAETLRDGALAEPETAIRFTDRILQQCDRLQTLLADLLTLSRLERRDVRPERRPVRLDRLVQDAVDTLQAAAAERRVELELHLQAEARLEGDPEALSELCLNLIDNAIKYNRDGGRVTARLGASEAGVLLEIADTGRGIPEAALPRIFERFYRVDRGRSRKEGGTGLGLAIAKHAAELHGGRIEVESTLGKGSIFRVLLPSTESGQAQATGSSPTPAA